MTKTLHKFIIHNRTKMGKASKVWKFFLWGPWWSWTPLWGYCWQWGGGWHRWRWWLKYILIKTICHNNCMHLGIITTLNYSFTIRTIRIVGTEYHYSVFIFGPFSKPEYIRYSVFGPFSKPEHIRYSVFGHNLLFGPTLTCTNISSARERLINVLRPENF